MNLLSQVLNKTTDDVVLLQLAQGLSAVVARLEPKEVAKLLSQAMSNSGVLVTPRMIAPARRRRSTKAASCVATKPARSRVPASHFIPETSIELLMLIGTPCSGPRTWPLITAASAARACRRTRSGSTWTKAFNFGFRRSILARCVSARSIGEIARART